MTESEKTKIIVLTPSGIQKILNALRKSGRPDLVRTSNHIFYSAQIPPLTTSRLVIRVGMAFGNNHILVDVLEGRNNYRRGGDDFIIIGTNRPNDDPRTKPIFSEEAVQLYNYMKREYNAWRKLRLNDGLGELAEFLEKTSLED